MKLGLLPTALSLTILAISGAACTSSNNDEEEEIVGQDEAELSATSSFTSRGTGYYPDSSALEGGFLDRKGAPLKTLQAFLAGTATYVSVAMDVNAFKYGQRLRIRELETKYNKPIVFRVVDTGGAFRGKGRSRIDICVKNRSASLDSTVNGTLHIDVVNEATSSSSSSSSSSSGGSSSSSGGGAACSSDGQCNPGNDGSGKICTSGQCVAGCRTNAQCPGSTTCVSGQCE